MGEGRGSILNKGALDAKSIIASIREQSFPLCCLVLVSPVLLLLAELEVLGPLQSKLLLGLALKPQHNLPGSLSLLVEHGLGLSSESHLLGVVTALSLGKVGSLSSLVLGDLVDLVLAALLVLAVSAPLLGYVNHILLKGEEGGNLG